MPSYGLLIDADEHDQSAGARGSGSCYWRADDQEQPHQATPGPHCVTFAERGGNGSSFSTFDRLRVRSVGAVNVPAGDWRSSYWSAFAGASGRSDFLALWLAYAI